MKFTILGIILLSISSLGFSSDKICFYASGSYGAKGDYFLASVTSSELNVKNVKGENAWDGVYTKKSHNISGKDGKTYLNFDANGDEGCNTILVDTALTTSAGSGYIKFICRGEGFNQESFFCKNTKN
jgi:hypothetical protein